MVICLARPEFVASHGMSETGGCGGHCGRRASFRVRPAIGLATASGAAASRDGRAVAQGRRREGLDRSGQRRYRRGLQRLHPEFRFRRARERRRASGSPRSTSKPASRRTRRPGPMPSAPAPFRPSTATSRISLPVRTWRRLASASRRSTNRPARTPDEKAWADAVRTGTASAFNTYLQNYGVRRACRRGPCSASPRSMSRRARTRTRRPGPTPQRTGTAAAFNGYIQNFSSGAHVAEARQRAATLEAKARKDADDKAWADAQKAGTSSAYNTYLQNFGTGAYAADARRAGRHDRCARAKRGAHRRHSENLPGRRRRDGQPVGRKHDRPGRQGMPGLGAKGPRADHQGPGDVFGGRQIAVHANGPFISRAMWNGSPASRWKETFARCRWGNRARPSTTTLPKVRPATNW